jgi:hypothetical protein
MLTKV